MLDPVLRQHDSRARAQAATAIRNLLQLEAREIIKQVNAALSSGDRTEMAKAFGAASAYVAIRERLMPVVATDGYTREIDGATTKLRLMLASSASTLQLVMEDRAGDSAPIRAEVKTTPDGALALFADGYGHNCDHPVVIENIDGHLQVLIWAKVKKDYPTHIISLECAHDSALAE